MKNEKVVFRGRLIKVMLKKVRLPNGYVATYEMLRHPGAALIVPFLSRDKILLLRQLRPVIGKYIYEVPAGTLDKGEKPLACAKREIIEETGYRAKKVTYVGKIYPVPGYSTERIYMYKAEGLVPVEREAEKDEVIETRVFTRRQVRALVKAGKIEDAKTFAALAVCGWL